MPCILHFFFWIDFDNIPNQNVKCMKMCKLFMWSDWNRFSYQTYKQLHSNDIRFNARDQFNLLYLFKAFYVCDQWHSSALPRERLLTTNCIPLTIKHIQILLQSLTPVRLNSRSHTWYLLRSIPSGDIIYVSSYMYPKTHLPLLSSTSTSETE